MNIRQANKNDLEEILQLNEAEVPKVNSIKKKDFAKFLEIASNFVVIENLGVPAGFMITLREGESYKSMNYQFFINHYKKFEYVDRIVIKEEFKGQGLGKRLYKFLIEKSEAEIITCEVNIKPENTGSLAFHQKMGFNDKGKLITDSGKKIVSLLVKEI